MAYVQCRMVCSAGWYAVQDGMQCRVVCSCGVLVTRLTCCMTRMMVSVVSRKIIAHLVSCDGQCMSLLGGAIRNFCRIEVELGSF